MLSSHPVPWIESAGAVGVKPFLSFNSLQPAKSAASTMTEIPRYKCVFIVRSLFSMTISTKSLAGNSTHCMRFCIGVRVTSKACCTGIRVPIAVITCHKPAWMCFGIRTLNAVRVDMTLHAHGVGPFNIVTRLATFYFASCKPCVFPTASPDADRDKSRSFMRSRNCSA